MDEQTDQLCVGDFGPVNRFAAFIYERYRIFQRKEDGYPAPWTRDPILREWRFCNVFREDDRVTRWIKTEWRWPNRHDRDLWFAMVVARFVNWPDTLEELGYPVPWDPERFLSVTLSRKQAKQKVYGGAYMIRADSGTPGRTTPIYQAMQMFGPLWSERVAMRPQPDEALTTYHARLTDRFGFGSFMAGQVVADLKYVMPLLEAHDWWTFACSGPGSRRGLNRVLGRPPRTTTTEVHWRAELRALHDRVAPMLERGDVPRMHAQDLQNCLCEFDKYERVRLGEGQPRARYKHAG